MAPLRTAVPEPDLVSLFVQPLVVGLLRMPEIVPPWTSKIPPLTERAIVPVVPARVPEVIWSELTDWLVVVRSSVPPLTTRARPAGRAPLAVSCSVPAVTLVPPV